MFSIREKLTSNEICESCTELREDIENCKKILKKYNKRLILAENIERLQKESKKNNEWYFKINTKYIKIKEQYSVND